MHLARQEVRFQAAAPACLINNMHGARLRIYDKSDSSRSENLAALVYVVKCGNGRNYASSTPDILLNKKK